MSLTATSVLKNRRFARGPAVHCQFVINYASNLTELTNLPSSASLLDIVSSLKYTKFSLAYHADVKLLKSRTNKMGISPKPAVSMAPVQVN
jgi:hypothetical protein